MIISSLTHLAKSMCCEEELVLDHPEVLHMTKVLVNFFAKTQTYLGFESQKRFLEFMVKETCNVIGAKFVTKFASIGATLVLPLVTAAIPADCEPDETTFKEALEAVSKNISDSNSSTMEVAEDEVPYTVIRQYLPFFSSAAKLVSGVAILKVGERGLFFPFGLRIKLTHNSIPSPPQ